MPDSASDLRDVPTVVLAAGRGTRLGELTLRIPKPLAPVAGVPILDRILERLAGHGIRRVACSIGHLGSLVERRVDGLRDGPVGSSFDRLGCSTCPTDLGTAGGARLALRDLPGETILVVSGDVLTDMDLSRLVAFHRERGADFTIALTRVNDPSEFGLVETDESGRVVRFEEKPAQPPPRGEGDRHAVNAGIYVARRSALEDVPEGVEYDFARDLIPALATRETVFALPLEGYWYDIGTPENLAEANRFFDALGEDRN